MIQSRTLIKDQKIKTVRTKLHILLFPPILNVMCFHNVLAPKRAHTAFYLFTHSIRNEMKSKFPEKKSNEISRIIAAKWKEISDEEKAPFVDEAKQEKLQYKEEMEKHMQSEEYKAYLLRLQEWQIEHGETTTNSNTVETVSGPPKKPKDLNGLCIHKNTVKLSSSVNIFYLLSLYSSQTTDDCVFPVFS